MRKIQFLVFATCIFFTLSEEIYMSSKDTCKVCDCNTNEGSLTINCTKRELLHLPAAWPSTDKLLIVNYSYNHIGTLPQLAESTAESISLTFSHCELMKLENAVFIDMKNIMYVDLSWNFLKGDAIYADVFRGRFSNSQYEPLEKLTALDLSHNDIHALGQKVFEHLPNLRYLSLKGNPLKSLSHSTLLAIETLTNIYTLDLSSTELEHIEVNALNNLKKLKIFNIANNELATVPESIGALGKSLIHLNISGNPIQKINDESFLGLEKLTHLFINNMEKLEVIHSGTFSQLVNLRVLHCENNILLTEVDPNAFNLLDSEKRKIREISLRNNSIKYINISFDSWTTLNNLDLSENPWFCNCPQYDAMVKFPSRLRNHKHIPMCSRPVWLSGTSLYDIPESICEFSKVEGNAMIDLIDDEIDEYYFNNSFEHNMKHSISVIRFILILCVMICLIVIVAMIISTWIKYFRKNDAADVSPVQYRIARQFDY